MTEKIRNKMINIIEDLEIGELEETNYIKPIKVKFTFYKQVNNIFCN